MSASLDPATLAADLDANLPFLRRFARALTGSQTDGDELAANALEVILTDTATLSPYVAGGPSLFRLLYNQWVETASQINPETVRSAAERNIQTRLDNLTPRAREALLLRVVEQQSIENTAYIMNLTPEKVSTLARIGADEMENILSARILIVEDEVLIALDLEAIVTELGHSFVGNARTHDEALALYNNARPDLVLMDVNLADGSNGAEAAAQILAITPEQPIIFITAYPERLLTGKGAEPTFLVTKPFSEEQVRATISQALFFADREIA